MYKSKRNNNGGIIALSWTKKRNDCENKIRDVLQM